MLIHLVPKLFLKYKNSVDLVSISVDDRAIDRDLLVIRKPYPNKCYSVACRKKGKKAISGILVELADKKKFKVEYTWIVEKLGEVKHIVHYEISDSDYDMVSDDITLSYASSGEQLGYFESRFNDRLKNITPASGNPYAEIIEPIKSKESAFPFSDTMEKGIVKQRVEYIYLPTIEKERFIKRGKYYGRYPAMDDKFVL